VVTVTQPGAWLEVQTGKLAGYVYAEFCEVKP
jgi:hypothetical protein